MLLTSLHKCFLSTAKALRGTIMGHGGTGE